jgi:hypothetical protein
MTDFVHDSPEVSKSAPALQQWFRAVYAEGRDTPIEHLCTGCCDSPPAMPMSYPAAISVWRMTSTH